MSGDFRTVPVLSVDGLTVDALTDRGAKRVLDAVSFDLAAGETLCLAGESGSGKSVTSLSVMRLLPRASLRIVSGSIKLGDRDLTGLSERAMREVRGRDIAMIFQEPMTSLNPVMTIGKQLVEPILIHQGGNEASARAQALRMLEAVQITEPARRLGQYPHELSGGMRQRVMIAMALSCRPKVLIADEPTTALDVTVQAQILKLMRELKGEFGTSTILITHDMGVVAEMADRVAVMKDGRLVEIGSAVDIFERPTETYTRELIAAVPRIGARAGTDGPPAITAEAKAAPPAEKSLQPVLAVNNLKVTYGARASLFGHKAGQLAVDGVSFELRAGRTLGLVGESGSGKSTTGKAVLGLIPYEGYVAIDGEELMDLSVRAMRPVRRLAQMIFQDPYASLDSRMTVGAAIAEPMLIHGIGDRTDRTDRVAELLRRVGLTPDVASRYPHEFSGGQRQRICIARALSLKPKLIVADESVAALDVSVRAKVLDLMLELQETEGLAYLFISHDMAVIERMSHDVAVMNGGRIVEHGPRRAVFENPEQDYTRRLIAAVPIPDPSQRRLAMAG
ncbi:ABC transporter ATP-binding protein [Pleomorphomonas sp. T1.2MG-36]|uniref:ABC transporter ATP-binding protein n=1 Tax=Pleomorphomonas sp. T1.2MG-36 TaxID=3041167 RepID=UPI00253F8B1F|nr:ABC transporter ATP-binding protein [Pleomorphomonas sp. T1.2MG-36]